MVGIENLSNPIHFRQRSLIPQHDCRAQGTALAVDSD
jgi:hypothetical protein